jgi:hypothetical protein
VEPVPEQQHRTANVAAKMPEKSNHIRGNHRPATRLQEDSSAPPPRRRVRHRADR